MTINKKTLRICQALKKDYGALRLGNKQNPLNEYLFILLSLRTTYWSFEEVYRHFKRTFPKWEYVATSSVRSIAKTIKDAGLSSQKSIYIKKTLKILKKDYGKYSLSPLSKYSDTETEKYLLKLPGVGLKSAKCIMMYSLGRAVLPVDTHTMRLSKRFGIVNNTCKSATEIEARIPKEYRYSYHVGCVAHGRTICLAKNPQCLACNLSKYCRYFTLSPL
jgi:endonuclease III